MTHRGTLPHHPLRLPLRNDHGIALPMVLMVFIVGVALISAFLVAIVGSSQVTATNKNIVQAQAAAEAGIAAAEATMRSATIDPCLTDLSALASTGTLTYSFSTAVPTCEGVAPDRRVVIRATGTASGASATVETVYRWVPGGGTSGGAGDYFMYVAGTSDLQNNSIAFLGGTSPNPVIAMAESGLACKGQIMPGSLLIKGNFTVDSGGTVTDSAGKAFNCIVKGSAHFGSNLNINATLKVEGDLRSAGTGEVPIKGDVTGSVFANGAVTLSNGGLVGGNISTSSNVSVGDNARVGVSGTPENDGNINADGNVTLGSGSVVEGSVTARGTVTLTGTARVKGSITAIGDVSLAATSNVEGDVTSGGKIDANGQVGIIRSTTDHTAGNLTTSGGVSVANGREVPGRIRAGSNVDLNGGNWVGRTLSGCVVQAPAVNWNSPPAGLDIDARKCTSTAGAPATPTVSLVGAVPAPPFAPWREYTHTPEQAALWAGFEVKTYTGSSQCDPWNKAQFNGWKQLGSSSGPVLYDLRNCGLLDPQNVAVEVRSDAVLLVDRVDFKNVTVTSQGGVARKLWIVDPGTRTACTVGSDSVTIDGTDFNSPITTMVYTPCGVHMQNSSVVGSIYAGGYFTQGSAIQNSLTFSPIGLPGWSSGGTTGGGGGTTSGTPRLGEDILLQRNVD
ncbi:bactofilin family protein [Leucobacter sp. W1038]|uniref:bactofilin family protein n=1 Tax=Leucobacter sp. W1038 TaxID=3438281 RepID=UPI003D996A88